MTDHLSQSGVPARWCSRCEWYVPAAHEPHRSSTLGWHYADLDVAPDEHRGEQARQPEGSPRLVGADREPIDFFRHRYPHERPPRGPSGGSLRPPNTNGSNDA